jgi:hypothetical protein
MEGCMKLVTLFENDPICEAFLWPVDVDGLGLHDYPDIITEPMDIMQIKEGVAEGKYSTVNSFAYDLRLVWKNCMRYNRPDSELYETAEKLSRKFEKALADLKKKLGSSKSSRTKVPAGKASRLKLSADVHLLTNAQLGNLVDIILRNCPDAITDDDEDLEIELNDLDDSTFEELQAFVSQSIGASKNKKRKTK